MQVLTINGEDALAHIITFANRSVGVSKDLGTRVNLALTMVEPTPDAPEDLHTLISGPRLLVT